MPSVTFSLSISAEKYLQYYKGHAKAVIVQSDDGRSVQFPAEKLQPYLLHDGIHGRFRIVFDSQNKYQSIEKIS